MIDVLRNVVDTLDQDILAVVIGDHGMDHEGENTAATVTSNSLLASGSIPRSFPIIPEPNDFLT